MNQAVHIVLVSNIVLEPYLQAALADAFSASGRVVDLTAVAYAEYGAAEHMQAIREADMAVAALHFEELYPDVCAAAPAREDVREDAVLRCRELYAFLKERTSTPVLWLGFEDYGYPHDAVFGAVAVAGGLVDRVNAEVMRLIEKRDVFLDLKRIVARVGIAQAYSRSGKHRWHAPYAKALIGELAREVHKQYLIHAGITKKCLVLDCDGVLWGGVLSEDGIENIRVGVGSGAQYRELQRFLLTLHEHGVILAVCTKNDEADVRRVFREHSGMILREEHIAAFRANWEPKPRNICAIAEELNIGLESMVLLDDSAFEVGAVSAVFPEVTAVLYHRDTVYDALSCFHLPLCAEEETVRLRAETYRTNARRECLQAQSASHEAYLQALQTRVDIHPAAPSELARIAELSCRTSKCTNGVRYTVDRLQRKAEDGAYRLYAVCVADRFSDLGLVGVVGIDGETADLFALSCRALGREIEAEMLALLQKQGAAAYRFLSTEKNEEIRSKFDHIMKEASL